MISLTPNGSPAETSAAYTLLEIIADPTRAKKHLDALIVEKQSSIEAMNNANAALGDAKTQKSAADRTLAEAVRVSSEFNATHAARKKQLDDHSDFLATKQKRLDDQEEEQSARHADIDRDLKSREGAVKAREADVTKREEALRATESAAQLLKENYERKVAALQAALSPEPVDHVMQADTGMLGASMGALK